MAETTAGAVLAATVRLVDVRRGRRGPETDHEPMRLEFAGELWCWRGPAPFHFITVPEDGCAALRAVAPMVSYGWGMIPVRVRIGRTEWETSLFPKDGRYVVPIKDVVRTAERLAEGDAPTLEMTIRS